MSRWLTTFENHPFQQIWLEVTKTSNQIVLQDETIITDVLELARLKKVITYISELIDASDPELVPLSIWDAFQDQANQCRDQLAKFDNSKNIGHIIQANSHLDNLLTYIRPYVAGTGKAAQAAVTAFKSYSKTIQDQIDFLSSRGKSAVNLIEEYKVKSAGLLEEIDVSQKNIENLENELLIGNDGEKSLQAKINELLIEATDWHTQINEFHKRLTTADGQEISIILQIEEAKNEFIEYSEDIKSSLTSSETLVKNLKDFHEKIFGKEDADGNLRGGLQDEINDRFAELTELKTEIDNILPGAITTGLAKAFYDMRKSFTIPILGYSIVFYLALLVIAVIGFEFTKLDNDPLKMISNGLYKIPIILPLLWLAIFVNKRRSENRRLQQEYAHKETVTKSYQSFKMQIEALNQEADLTKKLLDTAISAIAFNASETLDKKHGDKLVFIDALENVLRNLGIKKD